MAAEISPDEWVDLNGDNGTTGVPLGQPLHILTAWDPGGHPAPVEANRQAQEDLAAELSARGCSLLRARGRSPDGTFTDEGLAVHGLDRPTAREIAGCYGQEAIYELDPVTLHLISCAGNRVTSIPRYT